MSKINELRAQRAKTWEQTKAFLDSHRSDKGVLSAEGTATYEKMEQEIVDLGREIERQERLDAFERELNTPVNTPITQKPDTAKVDTKTGRASDAYKKAFWAQARTKGGMLTAEIRNALQEGVDSEGGYLVPDEFEQTLVQSLSAENVVRSLAHVITTASGSHKIPIVATKGTAAWVDEEGTIPEGDDAFGQQLIGAHKVATMIKVSEELLNDSTMKNIRKLKDSNGQYLWQPALHEGGYDTLLGKRIYTSPYAPELAAGQKTVAFGDFNYYWIGDRLGITFKRLNERFAETGQIGFIASKRLDGKLILPEAIKVLQQKGSASSGG